MFLNGGQDLQSILKSTARKIEQSMKSDQLICIESASFSSLYITSYYQYC